MNTLDVLASALIDERDAILSRWREQVRALPSASHLDLPTLNDHMPVWLAELAEALHASLKGPGVVEDAASPAAHGLQRFTDGFDIEEVVAEYNILRDCVHEVGERLDVDLRG
ncbi:MAG: RsbRD N-terminal domain-containing protein, partial [Usitatibacter sp.]